MIREIMHFVRIGPEVRRLQKQFEGAEFMDAVMAKADAQGFADVRRELVGDLTGRVLEIGCGTGAMFEHYGAGVELDAIEPEPDFLALAARKAAKSQRTIRATDGDAMNLAFPDDSFDAVVSGLVLCSVPSVERALGEAHRVLRKGGQLRALEHVRSDALVDGVLMDVTNPLWLRMNGQGCNWNRRTLPQIEAAGFRVDDVQSFQRFDTLMPALPMRRVRAHKPAESRR